MEFEKLPLKYISYLLNAIIIISFSLLLTDQLTPIDLIDQGLKSFAYMGTMSLCLPAILWNFGVLRSSRYRTVSLLLNSMCLVVIIVLGPLGLIFSQPVWNTQTILYQDPKNPNHRVEFQMQDIGALGYNRRTVEVYDFIYGMIIARPIDTKHLDSSWTKVTIVVDQLKLK